MYWRYWGSRCWCVLFRFSEDVFVPRHQTVWIGGFVSIFALVALTWNKRHQAYKYSPSVFHFTFLYADAKVRRKLHSAKIFCWVKKSSYLCIVFQQTERPRESAFSLIPWIVNLDTSLKHKVGIRQMDFSLVLYSYSYDILQVGLFKEPYLLYAKWESKPNYPR
jgi:hypothetical protein